MFWDILGCFGKFWDNCCLIGVVREDFELPNVDFLWNFSVRGLVNLVKHQTDHPPDLQNQW